KPAPDAKPNGGGSSHPAASGDSNHEELRRWAEPPPPAAKANGVHAPAAKASAAALPVAARAANGHANGHAAPAAVAASKQPSLSTTMAYAAAAARAPAERSIVPPPAPSTPVVIQDPAKGSVELVLDDVLYGEPPPPALHGTFTASDHAALQSTFEDLAVPHMAEVRSVMMELQWGEVQSSWLELARPALRSLRKMAEPVGNLPLCEALDKFDAALAEVLGPGQPPEPSGPARDALLAAYAALRTCLPRAFDLDGERDRREPLIVAALLEQVPGLEPLMIEKMLEAGLGKLSALYAARADEIAAVTGIPTAVAVATAARIQAFRSATPAGLATVDTASTLRELSHLLDTLRAQHAAFEEAARGWSDSERKSKKQLRRDRQVSFLQVTIELVRLGEVDLAQRLGRLPFAKKIDEVDRMVGQAVMSAKVKDRAPARTMAGAGAAT
ncbi:MAG TPA: helix-hairpin-helix domain-containing protein, partial [Burkholderiales bacterium]|nr:helix-hairpin-helix domain-containing protein [Burkholderiales bacterium]